MIHKLLHLLGWNTGTIETWWENNRLYVGFKCSGCGKISGVTDITDDIERDIRLYKYGKMLREE